MQNPGYVMLCKYEKHETDFFLIKSLLYKLWTGITITMNNKKQQDHL